jgi:hypothetical protein
MDEREEKIKRFRLKGGSMTRIKKKAKKDVFDFISLLSREEM